MIKGNQPCFSNSRIGPIDKERVEDSDFFSARSLALGKEWPEVLRLTNFTIRKLFSSLDVEGWNTSIRIDGGDAATGQTAEQ
jgi:hypothetical protein